MKSLFFRVLLMIATVVVVGGCTNPVQYERAGLNAERAKQIELGMTKSEVMSLMGDHDQRFATATEDGDVETLSWLIGYRDHMYVVVSFLDGRVVDIIEKEGPEPGRR